ncbi:cyclic GMP-AMP synthase-like receptor 2 [Mytilus galloprovincialis]|uniref:cyclic GMP-AMP synthase-like receptor 2 n=1 Tax=Mytilus galloprovincialis TaxID=29158 RepID=UPI003F7BAA3B
MQNTSKALYRYLCQNIVGTDHCVKTIRHMNSARDNATSGEFQTVITSGSFGEGLDMKGSDLDMMYVSKHIEVYEYLKPRLSPNITYLSMRTDDVKPGFTHLLVEKSDDQYFSKNCEEHNGIQYVSSSLYKQHMISKAIVQRQVIHGPCISDEQGTYDLAYCLHCKTWISPAEQWIRRSSNNSWPSKDVKRSIVKHGVLFVPIGVKGSPKEDKEWRISFSVGEKLLIHCFTHTQLLCYALLKILLKDVIDTYQECKDLLCSYFLKTIMLWISEELPQSVWKPQNLIPCFLRCLSRLVYCVEYSICLNYFIPENNMFENRIEGQAREIMLEKLHFLYGYGWRCILFSDQVSDFHVSIRMAHIEPNVFHDFEVQKTLKSPLLYMSNLLITSSEVEKEMYRGIQQIISCENSFNKYLFAYYLSIQKSLLAQLILLNSTKSSNKDHYNLYNSCVCSLLQNIYHDAISGWLMLASLFYQTKQYSKALHLVRYTLLKSTREKLLHSIDMSDIHSRFLNLPLSVRKSIVQLRKLMLLDDLRFIKRSVLIPNELRMEVRHEPHHISSVAYAYFLKSTRS